MEEVPADPQVTFPINAEPMQSAVEDDTSMATPTAMETDPLHLAHQHDEVSLAVASTSAAYGPFEIEYMECLDAVFNGQLPNGDNAFFISAFHADHTALHSRRPALATGRFCRDEWDMVVNNPKYLVGEWNKDQFVISRGQLSKVRSAIFNVVPPNVPKCTRPCPMTIGWSIYFFKLSKGKIATKNSITRRKGVTASTPWKHQNCAVPWKDSCGRNCTHGTPRYVLAFVQSGNP